MNKYQSLNQDAKNRLDFLFENIQILLNEIIVLKNNLLSESDSEENIADINGVNDHERS